MTSFLTDLSSGFSQYDGMLQAGQLWQQSATANAARSAAQATNELRGDVQENTAVQKKVLESMEEMTGLQRETHQLQQQQLDLAKEEHSEKARVAEYRKLLAFTKHLISEFGESGTG
tara:strand:+ start:197 stop:547 length:351 start_codon:yes stop_codon:yes gene_type:complete